MDEINTLSAELGNTNVARHLEPGRPSCAAAVRVARVGKWGHCLGRPRSGLTPPLCSPHLKKWHDAAAEEGLDPMTPRARPSVSDIAWAAAVFDCEGFVTGGRKGKPPRSVQVSTLNRWILDELARMFGGPVLGPYGP